MDGFAMIVEAWETTHGLMNAASGPTLWAAFYVGIFFAVVLALDSLWGSFWRWFDDDKDYHPPLARFALRLDGAVKVNGRLYSTKSGISFGGPVACHDEHGSLYAIDPLSCKCILWLIPVLILLSTSFALFFSKLIVIVAPFVVGVIALKHHRDLKKEKALEEGAKK